MKLLAEILTVNILAGGTIYMIVYFRYLFSPSLTQGVAYSTAQPLIYIGIVFVMIFGLVVLIILTIGTRMARNLSEFFILYEKDSNRLREFDRERQIRTGVEIINLPYTAAILTVFLGMVTSLSVHVSVYVLKIKPLIALPSATQRFVDDIFAVTMMVVCVFFFLSLYVPKMVGILEKAGFTLPDYHHPDLIRIGIRTKIGFAFLFTIVLAVYLFGTDFYGKLKELEALGSVPTEVIRSEKIRITVNSFMVGSYSILLVFFLTRYVTGALYRLVRGTEAISGGELEGNIELFPVTVDRIGDLGRAIDTVRGHLAEQFIQIRNQSDRMQRTLGTVRETVPVLMNSTGEMQGISRKQESGISQQVSSLQSIRKGVEDLSRVARKIAERTDSVVKRVSALQQAGERGARAIGDSRESIGQIAGRMREIDERIRRFSRMSQDVERILKIIEEISARGDILALNATLQGASAGEAGVGFIKIADRMRNLAVEVIREVDHIRPVLQQVEFITDEIHRVIVNSIEETEKGSKLVIQASEAFQKIYQSVELTFEAASAISQGTQRQRKLAGEMMEHIRKVDDIAESGSAVSRDSTEMAELLVRISSKLQSLVLAETSPS